MSFIKTIRLLNEDWVCPLKCDAQTAYIIAFDTLLPCSTNHQPDGRTCPFFTLWQACARGQQAFSPCIPPVNYFCGTSIDGTVFEMSLSYHVLWHHWLHAIWAKMLSEAKFSIWGKFFMQSKAKSTIWSTCQSSLSLNLRHYHLFCS